MDYQYIRRRDNQSSDMPFTIPHQTKLQNLIALLIGTYVAHSVFGIYEGLARRSEYLYWDPASHASYGVLVSSDILHANFLELIKDLNSQVLWPPLHSLVQIPFMISFGRSFYSSSLCSLFFLVLFFPAITFVYQKLSQSWSGWFVLMSLAATCPYLLGYGSMPMLEIFGAVLSMVSIGLYLKNSKFFPISLTALFFLKYNYCFYVLMPVIFLETWRAYKNGTIKSLISRINGFQIFVFIYLFFLLILLITGGFKIGNISLRKIGNPLYFLLLLLTVRLIHKKRYLSAWEKIRGSGWEYFFIPVCTWLLIPIPNRIKTLVSFSINMPLSGYTSSQIGYYTFYFGALKEYFSNPYLLLGCVSAALIAIILYRKDPRILFLTLSFGLPFVLMTANQNKQARFLFTFVPILWLLFAYAVSQIKHPVTRMSLAIFLSVCVLFSFNRKAVLEVIRWPFVPENMDAPVRYISEIVSDAKQIRVLGVRNDLSPALIMHHVMKHHQKPERPVFKWQLESNLPSGTNVVLINTPGPAGTKVQNFPGNISIGYYVVK